MNKKEATLLGYKVLYNRAGKLITERTSTDITSLKQYFTAEEYATLQTVVREGTNKLDEIHNYITSASEAMVYDVDGDGKVTALGDGLMVIRKLFGAAFAGDALTDKAMSDDATRTVDEIHEYISELTI